MNAGWVVGGLWTQHVRAAVAGVIGVEWSGSSARSRLFSIAEVVPFSKLFLYVGLGKKVVPGGAAIVAPPGANRSAGRFWSC